MKSTSKKRTSTIVNSTVKRRYLTQREIERLMECARKHGRYGYRDATMILVAYRHGFRSSELTDLRAVERVAKHLGNTPAVCRRCYIHPEIFEGFLDGTLLAILAEKTRTYLAEGIEGMSAEEAAVVAFLRLRLGELTEEAG